MMTEAYIYIDDDREDYFIFSELRLAKNEGWPADEDWEEVSEGEWARGDSCKIHLRVIDDES